MTIGYNRPLYILPFDHHSSFERDLFGWHGALSPDQIEKVIAAKTVIYDGFKRALTMGVSKDEAGILVDPQFGAAILADARDNGIMTCMPVEKSSPAEFQFEHGDRYAEAIKEFDPTFVKVLVRYNPEDDEALNRRQLERLNALSEYLHTNGKLFMFELFVPMSMDQKRRLEGNNAIYDQDLRPSLMLASIKELQNSGVEPDVWKIEGLDFVGDCEKIIETVQRGQRDAVSCIVLGRGSSDQQVIGWLRNAGEVPGFTGLAVGRTSFWDSLIELRDHKITRELAVEQIAKRYIEWVTVFQRASRRAPI
ncbi:MAG TPA: DUF2090 domain-containing protein [Acidiphilium sp.]|nr:DUF2090 domain-containing protein [Acidiphilium sp.]